MVSNVQNKIVCRWFVTLPLEGVLNTLESMQNWMFDLILIEGSYISQKWHILPIVSLFMDAVYVGTDWWKKYSGRDYLGV